MPKPQIPTVLMEMLQAHSLNSTTLLDRILWIDGDSTVKPPFIIETITKGNTVKNLYVDEVTKDIKQFNINVTSKYRIYIKEELHSLNFDWNIPNEYKKIDVVDYIANMLEPQICDLVDRNAREERIALELQMFKQLGLFDTIKALIYIINTFIEKDIVWGVGRGSSVSSYLLYVIGVHDVDSFHYNLDITEFLRTT